MAHRGAERETAAPTRYPPLFAAADARSRTGRRRHVALVRADLLLITAAIAAGLVSALYPFLLRACSLAAAACLIGAVAAESASRLRRFDRAWFGGRAVAEAVKTATWRYMMRLAPYDTDAADATFARHLAEIVARNPDAGLSLPAHAPDTAAITEGMRAVHDGPFAERRARYLAERVGDQLAWYAARAARHRRAATGWTRCALALQCGAIVALLIRALRPAFPGIWGLVLTMGGGVAAWDRLNRNGEVSAAYRDAARDLKKLRDLIAAAPDEAHFGDLAGEAEETIAREYTRWAARRQ